MSGLDDANAAGQPGPGNPAALAPHTAAHAHGLQASSSPSGHPAPTPASTAAAAPSHASIMHGFPPATHMHAPGANVPAPQAITVTPHPRPPAAAAGPPATAAVPLVPHDIVAPQAAVPLSAAVASMHRAASADAGGFKRPRAEGAVALVGGHLSHSPSPPPDALGAGGETEAIRERERKRLAQNREAAKRFRQKKKNHMQELEELVSALRVENARLRLVIGGGDDQSSLGAAAAQQVPAPTATASGIGRGGVTSSGSGGGGDGRRGGAVYSPRGGADSAAGAAGGPAAAATQPQPPTITAARRWWDDLAALVARPEARSGAAAAVTAELRSKLEAYPELLKAALLDGHVLAITNGEHCPSALRAILWHGFLQPSEAVGAAASAALPEDHAAHVQLYELRSQMETQEAYIEQYTHSAAAELRRMLLDPAARAGLPQYLPFVAILPVAAAQLLCSLLSSMESILSPHELRNVMLTWLEATFSFPTAAAAPPSEGTVQVALSYLAGTAAGVGAGAPGDEAAAAAAAAAASTPPDTIAAAAAQIDPAYIAQAQAAALAMHYATHAGYAPAVQDPAHAAGDHLDPAAAAGGHPGFDPAAIAAMASAAALVHTGDGSHELAAAAAAAAAGGPSAEQVSQMYAAAYAAEAAGAVLEHTPPPDGSIEAAAEAAAAAVEQQPMHAPFADAADPAGAPSTG